MSVNHSVSDLVSHIKNGFLIKRDSISLKKSKLIINILQVLKKEGYIEGFEESSDSLYLDIVLKYLNGKSSIKEIEVLSKPSKRKYCSCSKIPLVYNGLGLVILSTPKGVMADFQARTLNMGGEILLKIF